MSTGEIEGDLCVGWCRVIGAQGLSRSVDVELASLVWTGDVNLTDGVAHPHISVAVRQDIMVC